MTMEKIVTNNHEVVTTEQEKKEGMCSIKGGTQKSKIIEKGVYAN